MLSLNVRTRYGFSPHERQTRCTKLCVVPAAHAMDRHDQCVPSGASVCVVSRFTLRLRAARATEFLPPVVAATRTLLRNPLQPLVREPPPPAPDLVLVRSQLLETMTLPMTETTETRPPKCCERCGSRAINGSAQIPPAPQQEA